MAKPGGITEEGRSAFCMALLPMWKPQPFRQRIASKLSQSPFCTPIHNLYSQHEVVECCGFAGRVFVDWGLGTRTWIQQAILQPKPITEITRVFREDEFPGYVHFISKLSAVEALPSNWLSALGAAKGVYLLTCPATKEQYVGAATSEGGFLSRWLGYVRDGHGGNVGLKSRDRSDYPVSILEVCGSAASEKEILAAEQLWKAKLQSREMGLNRNLKAV